MRLSSLALSTLLFGTIALAAPVHSPEKRALPRLGGFNIAGFDFGTDTNGGYSGSYVNPMSSNNPAKGQMDHFTSSGSNVFRLPFGWNPAVGGQVGGTLSASWFSAYDEMVQYALSKGAYVILDLHNYARWNGGIVGQGGPADTALANIWQQLATKYKSQPKVMFGLMNEPHDIPDMNAWGKTLQTTVNAIRSAGATSNYILLPGQEWTHAPNWISGANDAVVKVTDPSGGTDKLLFDVHQYLDSDGSGTHADCTTDNVAMMNNLASFLKSKGRQAILSETGGGPDASCKTALANQLKTVVANSAEIIGFVMWSGGAFDSSYVLSTVPVGGVDNALVSAAVNPYLPGKGAAAPAPAPSSSSAAVVTPSSKPVSSAQPTTSAKPSSSAAAPASSSSTKASVTAAPVTSSKASVTAAPVTSTKASVVPVTTTSKASSVAPAPAPTSKTSSSYVKPFSSAVPTTSKSSSKAPVTPPTSSQAPSSSAKPTTAKPTSSAAAPTTSAPSTAGNLQTYKGALGGFAAPAVTASGNQWKTGNNLFNFKSDALTRSCDEQMNLCQTYANSQAGRAAGVSVNQCQTQQQQACYAVAWAA